MASKATGEMARRIIARQRQVPASGLGKEIAWRPTLQFQWFAVCKMYVQNHAPFAILALAVTPQVRTAGAPGIVRPEVEPDRLLNDLRREAIPAVADLLHPHGLLGHREAAKPYSTGPRVVMMRATTTGRLPVFVRLTQWFSPDA
jgi:hypothetical protein